MRVEIPTLAFNGKWKDLLSLLRQQPDLSNVASDGKGYTPLHQAAWHGAGLPVIGSLLALGADRRLLTKEGETALTSCRSRYPDREDLHYILSPSTRSLAQLLRKLIAETQGLFSDYDGNRIICDRLITCFGETWDDAAVAAAPIRFAGARPRGASGCRTARDHRLITAAGRSGPILPADNFCFRAAVDFMLLRCCRRLATSPPAPISNSDGAALDRTSRSVRARTGAVGLGRPRLGWSCVRPSPIASFPTLPRARNARSGSARRRPLSHSPERSQRAAGCVCPALRTRRHEQRDGERGVLAPDVNSTSGPSRRLVAAILDRVR